MKKRQDFWKELKKRGKIYALAPMAGVTDSAFRQICKSYGADVVYSEMASATALTFNPKETLDMLKFEKMERPYVVQLFGSKPEHFAVAAKLVAKKIKPDGIDINFGCPVKKVQKQHAGASLMSDLRLSKKVIEAVLENANLPVSVKMRSASGKIDAIKFLKNIGNLKVSAVMIHGRTMAQGHAGEADWKIIREARKHFRGVLLANGGITSAEDARAMLEKTGADGAGIARGALGRPWIFKNIKNKKLKIKNEDVFKIALKHSRLAYKLKGKRGVIEMRKHLCWYVSGMSNASELRRELVKVEKINKIKSILITDNKKILNPNI